jgi:hypothetical protein
VKILLMFSTLIAGHAFAADVENTIRTTFVTPWIRALTSGQAEVLKRLLHPSVQACMNDETRKYLNAGIDDEFRGAKADYEITKLAPWNGPPPLSTLPADSFFYPVPPTYELNLQLEPSHTVIIRYLAETKGAWFEVEPCPNEKGIALIHDRVAQENQRRARAVQLAADLKEPLRGELLAILKQHRLTEAARKYQEAAGVNDFTIAVMVMNVLDPEHPLGKP